MAADAGPERVTAEGVFGRKHALSASQVGVAQRSPIVAAREEVVLGIVTKYEHNGHWTTLRTGLSPELGHKVPIERPSLAMWRQSTTGTAGSLLRGPSVP